MSGICEECRGALNGFIIVNEKEKIIHLCAECCNDRIERENYLQVSCCYGHRVYIHRGVLDMHRIYAPELYIHCWICLCAYSYKVMDVKRIE